MWTEKDENEEKEPIRMQISQSRRKHLLVVKLIDGASHVFGIVFITDVEIIVVLRY